MIIKCRGCQKDLSITNLVQKYHVECKLKRDRLKARQRNTKRIRKPSKTITIPHLVNERFKKYRKKHNISTNDCMLLILAETKHFTTLTSKIEKTPETVSVYLK